MSALGFAYCLLLTAFCFLPTAYCLPLLSPVVLQHLDDLRTHFFSRL